MSHFYEQYLKKKMNHGKICIILYDIPPMIVMRYETRQIDYSEYISEEVELGMIVL